MINMKIGRVRSQMRKGRGMSGRARSERRVMSGPEPIFGGAMRVRWWGERRRALRRVAEGRWMGRGWRRIERRGAWVRGGIVLLDEWGIEEVW